MSDGMTPEEKAWCQNRQPASRLFQGVTSKDGKPPTADDVEEARNRATEQKMRRAIALPEADIPSLFKR